eukprot:616252-Alexandrium_andersonii.AAC.1
MEEYLESSGESRQSHHATPDGRLDDLLGPLPGPLEMSGEQLRQLLTQVDALVGLDPVLRQQGLWLSLIHI